MQAREQVRRFNRMVTQRVGALESSYLQRGRPLGEARLLFEIGADGSDLRVIRSRLGLDSGYLSRLLRALQRQGLVTVQPQPDDARARRAVLTEKGRTELTTYDALSDQLADSILQPLDPTQRERLVAAMAEVERLIRAASLTLTVEPPDSADAGRCLTAYFRELGERFESGFDPARSNPADVAALVPLAGCFIVARLDGKPAGCGGLRRVDATTGEIKRMWTAPEARGLGVARRILQALEEQAEAMGLSTLRLETNRALLEAQALYRRAGYREVPPFNDEAYAHHWFAKRLRSAGE